MRIKLLPISKRAKELVKAAGCMVELIGASELAITVEHAESGYYGWLFLDTDVRYEKIENS